MYDSLKPELAPTVFALTGKGSDGGWFHHDNVGELAELLRSVADRLDKLEHVAYGLCGYADSDEFSVTWGFDDGQ